MPCVLGCPETLEEGIKPCGAFDGVGAGNLTPVLWRSRPLALNH